MTEYIQKQIYSGGNIRIYSNIWIFGIHCMGENKLEDKLLTDREHYRYLGLNFLNNSTWEAHITSGKIPLLKELRKQLDREKTWHVVQIKKLHQQETKTPTCK